MGCNSGAGVCPTNALDLVGWLNEQMCHEANVPAFEIDRTEVTVAQYKAYLTAKGAGCTNPIGGGSCVPSGYHCNLDQPGNDNMAVGCLTWYQANGYCAWAGGGTRRMCSESEWEKAARGIDGRVYPWGNVTATCDYAVMRDEHEVTGCGLFMAASTVGSKPQGASPYGALDMSGNLMEWVEDCYEEMYDGTPTDGAARESCTTWGGMARVARGGSWPSYADELRASYRDADDPASNGDINGTRCCADVF